MQKTHNPSTTIPYSGSKMKKNMNECEIKKQPRLKLLKIIFFAVILAVKKLGKKSRQITAN